MVIKDYALPLFLLAALIFVFVWTSPPSENRTVDSETTPQPEETSVNE